MAVITVLVSGIMATPDRQRPRGASRRHPPRPGVHHTLPATGIHPNPGLTVPEGVTAHQLEEAPADFRGGVELVVSGVNSFTVAWVGNQFASLLRPGMHVIVLAKGSDNILAILPGHSPRLPEELRSRASISAIAGT